MSKAYDHDDDIDGRSVQEWKAMAKLYGTQVIEVEPRSTHATQFCTNYRIGACLRWPVDFNILDEVASTHEPSEPTEPSEDLDVRDGPASAPSELPQPLPKEITIAATCGSYTGCEEQMHAEPDRLFRCAECEDAAELGAIDEADGLWYCKACWQALLNQPTEMIECPTSDSVGPECSGDATSAACAVPCLLEWLQGRLIAAIDDQCTVDGLMSWAEVLLSDDSTTEDCEEWESPIAQLGVLFHDEGVPEEIISQLAHRWASSSCSK